MNNPPKEPPDSRLPPCKRLLFAAAPLLLFLIVLEVVLRFGPPRRWLAGEELWQLQYVRANPGRRDNGHGTRADYPLDEHSPTLGWVVRAGYRSDGLNSNSHGLRGLREYPHAKPAGGRRIVVIGDSFAFGEGVRDEETFACRLETFLGDVSVPNLAVHGYGTDQQHLMLLERGFRYEPDLVVLAFFEHDTARNMLAFRDYAKPVYRFEDGRLVLHNVPVPPPAELRPNLPSFLRPRILGFLGVQTRAMWNAIRGSAYRQAGELSISTAILDMTAEACRQRGCRFLLLFIPEDADTEPDVEEAALAEWADRRGVPFVSMRNHFLELPTDVRAGLYDVESGGHWSPAAHDLCARVLKPRVESMLSGPTAVK